MAFNILLADRVRATFDRNAIPFEEKRMMGGLCFLVDGKMCVGISEQRLMVRLDPTIYEASLARPGCHPMDITGRPMRGFVFIDPEGTDDESSLDYWIDLALEFNPRARASKPKRPKTTNQRNATKKPPPRP